MTVPLQIGQAESVKRVFGQSDFDRFAALSGDDNPIHVDPAFAARTRFGRTVAHGMFLYGVVCGVLGSHLPGPGTIQWEQELIFPSPTYVGEEVSVQVAVTGLDDAAGWAELSTSIVRPDGNVGLQGRTVVRLPGPPPAPVGAPAAPAAPPADPLAGPSLKGLAVGHRAELRRRFASADLADYAALVGDANPIWTDVAYARRLGLPGLPVPGSLLGGLFSCLLGTRLPGQGTNYMKQRLHFPAPATAGQELVAAVEIVRIRPEKQLVNLSTVCTDPSGRVVCQGEALVLVSDVQGES